MVNKKKQTKTNYTKKLQIIVKVNIHGICIELEMSMG